MTDHDYGESVALDYDGGYVECRYGPIHNPPPIFTNAAGRADFDGTPPPLLLFGANVIDTPDPFKNAVAVEDGCAIVTSSTRSWTYRLSPAHWADGTADAGLYVGRWPD